MSTAQVSKTRSNTALAVAQLRDMIFAGDLGAGTDHLEGELAIRLGMSRTPVREALLQLEAQGLVEVRPRKGIHVIPLSPSDMAEIYDILADVEGLAVASAAERRPAEEDLQRLADSIAKVKAALDRGDREAWAAAEDSYHQELIRLGGNKRAQSIARMMADQVRRARRMTLYMRPEPKSVHDCYSRVLEAIRRGDAETARLTHRKHRLAAKEMLLDLLQRHRLSSI